MITTKADSRKRVVVPQAEAGRVYAVGENADGSITLTAVKPMEVAKVVAFLLSERSGLMTGSIIDFDQQVLGTHS